METPILGIWTQDNPDQYAPVQDSARTALDVEEAILNPPYVRLTNIEDASFSSTQHAFQIGPDTGLNVIADVNEIMARNAGGASQLNLNNDGGDVNLGNAASEVKVPGHLNSPYLPWAMSAGLITSASFGSGAGPKSVSVTFPGSRFSQAPRVSLTPDTAVPQNRQVGFSGRTASGMTVYQFSDTSTYSAVDWIAVQMTSGAASG